MDKENNANAPSYNSTLYAACKYIKDNNLFKKYGCYQNTDVDISEYDCSALHNCLKNSFDFLTGNSLKKLKEESAKGSDIMPSLRLEELQIEKLAIILTIFFKSSLETPKLTKHIFDVNIEKSLIILNNLINILNADYMESIKKIISETQSQDEKEQLQENDYCKVLDRVQNFYRRQLINYGKKYILQIPSPRIHFFNPIYFFRIHSSFKISIQFYYDLLFQEQISTQYPPFYKELKSLEKNQPHFGNLKRIYYTWLFCDLCCYFLMQTITNLFCKKNLKFSLEPLNALLLELIKKYSLESIRAQGTPEEILFHLSFYYYKRDLFLQNINILKFITKNCKRRENPTQDYRIPQTIDKKISINKIRNLFLEGEELNKKTFLQHYEICKAGIDQFNKKANRNLENNLITQKAFYQEIFKDKTLFKRRRSQRIFSDFLESDAMNLSDYYFLDEKINMGMYREYCMIDLFYVKNEFQENLYHLMVLILARLYPEEIINPLKDTFNKIHNKLSDILESNNSICFPY